MGRVVDVVVTDLDGTLWDASNVIEPSTRDAIDKLAALGVPVIVASARRPASIARILGDNGLMLPAVCFDGALVRDLESGENIFEQAFDSVVAALVLAAFRKVGVEPVVNVATSTARDCVLGAAPSTHPGHLDAIREWSRTGHLDEVIATEAVLGFNVCGLSADRRGELAALVPPDVSVTSGVDPQYGGFGLAARPPDVSKWVGVEAFCRERSLDPARVLAVGDGPNDVELLRHAAIACAIETAPRGLIDIADHVLGPPGSGGWAFIADLVST